MVLQLHRSNSECQKFFGLTARVANETQAVAKNCPYNDAPMKICPHLTGKMKKKETFLSELPLVRCVISIQETSNFHTIRAT
jgi:hypothetical protein